MVKQLVEWIFDPWHEVGPHYRGIVVRPGLDQKQRRRMDRLVGQAKHGDLAALAAELDPIVVCVPRSGATLAEQDWQVVDGIRADSRAYLLGRLKRDGSVRSRGGLKLDLDTCHNSYWQAAHTAIEIDHLLERVAASPDRAGRDVDAVYRTAIAEHRKLLGDLSAGVARLRAELELDRAQTRRIRTADAPLVADRANSDAAVRLARADLFGVPEVGPLEVPAAPIDGPPEGAHASPAASSPPKPPKPRKAPAPAATPPRRTEPGPPLILQAMQNTVPARQVASLASPIKARRFQSVEVAQHHVLYVKDGAEWIGISGKSRLARKYDAYWLVDGGWIKPIKWRISLPGDGTLSGSSTLFILDPQHVAAAHESGALSTDAIDAIVAAAASEWLDTPVAGSLTVSAEEALRSADRAWLDLLGNAILERTAAVLAGLGLGVAEVAVGRPRFRKQAGPPSAAAIRERKQADALFDAIAQDAERFHRVCGETLPEPDTKLRGAALEAVAGYARMAAVMLECMERGETAQSAASLAASHAFSALVSTEAFREAMKDTKMAMAWSRFAHDAAPALSRGLAAASAKAQAIQALPQPTDPASPSPTPTAVSEADPVRRLQQLNALLSAGLIDQGEFDAKRAEIIAGI